MKKFSFILALGALSFTARAENDFALVDDSDISAVISDHHERGPRPPHDNPRPPRRPAPKPNCGHVAWRHAQPSAEQNESAKGFFHAAMEFAKSQKEAVDSAKKNVHASLMKHPISKTEVDAAGAELHSIVVPVKLGFRNAIIDSINLLNANQRDHFNKAFHHCIRRGR